MLIAIDTEFNEYKGDLISMALVAEDGQEFYEVLPCQNPGRWVHEHVMPVVNKEYIYWDKFQTKLQNFCMLFNRVHLVADWPEDIQHFCNALIVGPGLRLNTPPLIMEIRRDLDAVSAIPHNALEDARAIMRKYKSMVA